MKPTTPTENLRALVGENNLLRRQKKELEDAVECLTVHIKDGALDDVRDLIREHLVRALTAQMERITDLLRASGHCMTGDEAADLVGGGR